MRALAIACPLAAAAGALIAFLPTVHAGFVNWDDEISFLTNPHYRGLGPAELRYDLATTLLGHWSPLTWLTWSANYVLGGMDPWGYHLANVLLHAATVALFCWQEAAQLAPSDPELLGELRALNPSLAAKLSR